MSLARRHYQQAKAAEYSAANGAHASTPADASAYELQLLRLAEDKRRLKDIQSIERKIDAKRSMLPEYLPWVQGVLAADAGGQDAVLMTVMVWRIDVGDYAGALEIARYALKHGLNLPDQYQRTLATLIAEEVADNALRQGEQGPDVHTLADVLAMVDDQDMPDEVRAKLHKALGLRHAVFPAPGEVLDADQVVAATFAAQHLHRAMQLNPRSGVKRDIERLERALKAAPAGLSAGELGEGVDPSAAVSPAPATQPRKAARAKPARKPAKRP